MAKRGRDDDPLAKRLRAELLPTGEIERLVCLREDARRDRDYLLADQLRAELRSHGVELHDSEREWRALDGRSGAITGGTCGLTSSYIHETLLAREHARSVHDWAQADDLRQLLRAHGVEIDDKKRLWTVGDGRLGFLPGKLAEEHVAHVVALREAARAKKDFAVADRLRGVLREVGVRLDDKQGTWAMEDGRGGALNPSEPRAAPPSAPLPSLPPPHACVPPGLGCSAAVPPPACVAAIPPPPLSQLEICILVRQLAEARLQGHSVVQEALCALLAGKGVLLNDAHATWHSADGRSGPTVFADAMGYSEALSHAACELLGRPAPQPAYIDAEDDISAQIALREQARAQRNFAVADRIREVLRARGVNVDDARAEWTAPDGRSGKYPDPSEAHAAMRTDGTLSVDEILLLVAQREAARRQRDYASADALRTRLRSSGVELHDKEKMWTCADGRCGTFSGEAPQWLPQEPFDGPPVNITAPAPMWTPFAQ
ncbi:hypothetical protein AB1Y20_003656 [Prymnesium parvum]|uniref:E3 ubiquitin-protein ligase n=1 Tax=Prymnesium parvum TaxID=97485 RepID=A0AB34J7P9_PRYPA